jgi:flagellar FliL protein
MSEEAKKEGEEGQKKKGKSKLLLLIIIGVVVLGGGGAAAFMMLGGNKGAPAAAAPTGDGHGAPAAAASHGAPAEGGHGAPVASHSGSEVLLPIDTFVINLADTRGDRFLKLSVKAVSNQPELEKQLAENELLKSRVRDRVISTLGAKTYQEINNPIGKEGLRRELAQELNGVLGPGSVSEILFTEFIVQ